jgi:hypothetical protein
MKRLAAIPVVIWAGLVTWACAPDPGKPAVFENLFGIALPPSAHVIRAKNKGSSGMIIRIKLSKAEYAILAAKKSEYQKWQPVDDGMSIDAASRSLIAPADIHGIYSVGRKTHGLANVLVWDEASETLTAFRASGIM